MLEKNHGVHISLLTRSGGLSVRYIEGHGKKGLIAYSALKRSPLLVRVHSSCVFSESLGAIDCDCSDQLKQSIEQICTQGGVLVYTYDEGRGVGLENKIKSISLQQEEGIDTGEAFHRLGFMADERTYDLAAEVLKADFGGDEPIELITNNPSKALHLRRHGLNIVLTRPVVILRKEIMSYLQEKADVLGHDIF